jgi:hypothetical protein
MFDDNFKFFFVGGGGFFELNHLALFIFYLLLKIATGPRVRYYTEQNRGIRYY